MILFNNHERFVWIFDDVNGGAYTITLSVLLILGLYYLSLFCLLNVVFISFYLFKGRVIVIKLGS